MGALQVQHPPTQATTSCRVFPSWEVAAADDMTTAQGGDRRRSRLVCRHNYQLGGGSNVDIKVRKAVPVPLHLPPHSPATLLLPLFSRSHRSSWALPYNRRHRSCAHLPLTHPELQLPVFWPAQPPQVLVWKRGGRRAAQPLRRLSSQVCPASEKRAALTAAMGSSPPATTSTATTVGDASQPPTTASPSSAVLLLWLGDQLLRRQLPPFSRHCCCYYLFWSTAVGVRRQRCRPSH